MLSDRQPETDLWKMILRTVYIPDHYVNEKSIVRFLQEVSALNLEYTKNQAAALN